MNAASADVNIEVKATDMNVSVTVPTVVPIVFNEDGTNTYPTNWTIENISSIAGIYLYSVDLTGNNGWKLLTQAQDAKLLAVDSKKVKFTVGAGNAMNFVTPTTETEGHTEFGATDIQLPSGTTKTLDFEVERGAFNQDASMEKAFDFNNTKKLGFGLMRLPEVDGAIDIEATKQIYG